MNWFTQKDSDSVHSSYRYKDCLFAKNSKYQKVEVFDSYEYGKILVLDDWIMTTERDEFIYHEVITHIPANVHGNLKHCLIIGGGDGGTVRELVKYPSIESITLCEIDDMVIEVSRQFFPGHTKGLDDPRVKIQVGDGVSYLKSCQSHFDLIVVDSTDPIGPGEGLFTGEFYRSCARALKPGGILSAQTQSPWFEKSALVKIFHRMEEGFASLRPYVAPIPTYQHGLWSFTLASQNDLAKVHENSFAQLNEMKADLQFLTPELARSLFHLPLFYSKKLGF